jgi:hypothetical protein
MLREGAERSIDSLWARIGPLLDAFTADECLGTYILDAVKYIIANAWPSIATPATAQLDRNLL